MGNPQESEAQNTGLRLRRQKVKSSKEKRKLNLKMNYIRDFVAAELASSNPSLKLDDRRLAKLLSTVKTPNHPPYALMIRSAMEKMNNGGESSEKAISEFIVREFKDLPLAHEGILKHHLGKLCDNGEIRLSDDELYVFVTDCFVGEGDVEEENRSREQIVEQGSETVRDDMEAVEAQIQLDYGVPNEAIPDEAIQNAMYKAHEEVEPVEAELNQKTPTASVPALQRRKLLSHDSVDPVLAVSVYEPPFLKQCETSNLSQRRKLRSHHKELIVSESVSNQKNEPQQNVVEKRRGRGRPPKPKPNAESSLSLAPKRRGRGRPPKPKPNAESSLSLAPKRRGRGRPPKPKPNAESSLSLAPKTVRPRKASEAEAGFRHCYRGFRAIKGQKRQASESKMN